MRAIIVTHDIELALKFATKIVLIDKKCEIINGEENYYGIINANSIYSKKDNTWSNASSYQHLDGSFDIFLSSKFDHE